MKAVYHTTQHNNSYTGKGIVLVHSGGEEFSAGNISRMGHPMSGGGYSFIPSFMFILIFILTACITLFVLHKRGTLKRKEDYRRFDLLRFNTVKRVFKSRYFQFTLQLPIVIAFVLVILTGILGSQEPGHNFATVATWTIWWSIVIFVILFFGAGWCLICPWSALSDWIERRTFWKRKEGIGLKKKWPRLLKNRYPMIIFLVIVTWLELGIFITYRPYYTGWAALLMFLLILWTTMIYDRKAFCRYICFVGGIIGLYSNLAPVEIRSKDRSTCRGCKTKECIRGNHLGYPCPIFEYPGGMDKNTNCIMCTECIKTCPYDNMTIRVRPFFADIARGYRGRYDEAVLALSLSGLTIYHGFTMLPIWFNWAVETMETNYSLYISIFTIMLIVFTIGAVAMHYILSYLIRRYAKDPDVPLKKIFIEYAYAFLPVALFYHLSHNISHLNMEGLKISPLLSDPFGWGWNILGTAGLDTGSIINAHTVHYIQFVIVTIGLIVGILFAYRTSLRLFVDRERVLKAMLPVVGILVLYTVINMYTLVIPMVMRTVSYF